LNPQHLLFSSSADKVDLVTPRTRIRLELEKLNGRASEQDEVKKVYRDVQITIQLPDGKSSVKKEVSVGESVGNIKFAICEGSDLEYNKIRLFLMPKHEPMLELLSLNDFTFISANEGDIVIQAEHVQ
jgi:hypothetical protein